MYAVYAVTPAHLDKGLLLGPGLLPSSLLMLLLGAGRGGESLTHAAACCLQCTWSPRRW